MTSFGRCSLESVDPGQCQTVNGMRQLRRDSPASLLPLPSSSVVLQTTANNPDIHDFASRDTFVRLCSYLLTLPNGFSSRSNSSMIVLRSRVQISATKYTIQPAKTVRSPSVEDKCSDVEEMSTSSQMWLTDKSRAEKHVTHLRPVPVYGDIIHYTSFTVLQSPNVAEMNVDSPSFCAGGTVAKPGKQG